jgi:DNA polymerase-3 subunit delta'
MEPQPNIAGFASIRGHEAVVERLERAIATGRVHHAYYFTGPDGVGKATTAVALAQALSCKQAPGRGCGACSVCSRLARNVHPDLVWVEAEGKQIKIQQIRQLEDRLAQGAHEARALMILLDEVERLNTHAANALLKSLEEPRAGVHFVLVSSASHRVPITIRSRCQQVRFGPLPEAVVAELLVERTGLDSAGAAEVARLADGSFSRALMLVEHEEFPVWQQWVVRLAAGDLPALDVPGQVQTLLREVEDPEPVLGLLRLRLRDHVLLAADTSPARLVQVAPGSPEAEGALRRPLVSAQRRLAAVEVGLRDLRSYVNKHLALERVLLQLSRP